MINKVINKVQNNINTNIEVDESFERLEITSSCNSIINLSNNSISILKDDLINQRDMLIDFILKINENPINYDFNDPDSFWNDYKSSIEYIDTDDEVICELKIVIKKIYKDNVLSIYSLNDFFKYLNSLKYIDLFKILYKYKNTSFEVLDKITTIDSYTNSFCFYSAGVTKNICAKNNGLLEVHSQNCNFANRINFEFEPDDFKLNAIYNNTLSKLFNKMYIIFCLIYIFDVSEIKDNNLELVLYGKTINKILIDLEQVDFTKLNIYTDIFKWIYIGPNTVDKLLIARNVLLANLDNKPQIYIPESILSTIKSNFKIYTTDNYEKYVNSKTAAISNLLDIQNKIFELSDTLSDNFLKNITVVGSFIFTVIVLNQVSNGKVTDIFSKDVTLISFLLIVLSFVFLNYTLNTIKSKKNNLSELQKNINRMYSDILSKETIDEITINNEYYKSSKKILNEKIKYNTKLWIFCIFVFWVLTLILGWSHYKFIFNYLFEHINWLINYIKNYINFKINHS